MPRAAKMLRGGRGAAKAGEFFGRGTNDTQVPVRPTQAHPATILPGSVELSALPTGLEDRIAAVRGYKYVKLPDKVLLVSPPNRVVVGEIAR